jgi:hypothetical protein
VELVPEYNRTERLRFCATGLAVMFVLFLAFRYWFFPWLAGFSANAHCQTVLGVNGTVALFYGLFVGVPAISGLLAAVIFGRRGLKVIQEGRTPPSGEKVFRPTAIVKGTRAMLIGYAQLLAFVPLIVLAVWGSFQAKELSTQAERPLAQQTSNSSINRKCPGKPGHAAYPKR